MVPFEIIIRRFPGRLAWPNVGGRFSLSQPGNVTVSKGFMRNDSSLKEM